MKSCFELCLVLTLIAVSISQKCTQPGQKDLEPLLDELSESGYTITKGWLNWDFNYNNLTGANPSAVYGWYTFPNLPSNLIPDKTDLHKQVFHPSDAILFIGCTPPDSAYFSSGNYLGERYNEYPSDSTKPSKISYQASLGDLLNHLIINTSSTYSQNPPFDEITTVVHTGDEQTYQEIADVISQSSTLQNTLNINPIPAKYFNFLPYNYNSSDNIQNYTASTIDTYFHLWRTISPYNSSAFSQYAAVNQTVYFLTMTDLNTTNDTQPTIPYEPLAKNTSTGNNESEIYGAFFGTFIDDVIEYVQNEYDMKIESISGMNNAYIPPYHYGFQCISNGYSCIGDSRDQQYFGILYEHLNPYQYPPSPQWFNLYNDTFYLVIGMNHKATQQTVYNNIAIYQRDINGGDSFIVGSIIEDDVYNNSALSLEIQTTVDEDILQKLYMVQISRPNNCIDGLVGFCMDEQELGYEQYFDPVTRNVLNPITKTRPNRFELIPDIFLKFKVNNEESTGDGDVKSVVGVIIGTAIGVIILVSVGIFIYLKFVVKKNPKRELLLQEL